MLTMTKESSANRDLYTELHVPYKCIKNGQISVVVSIKFYFQPSRPTSSALTAERKQNLGWFPGLVVVQLSQHVR